MRIIRPKQFVVKRVSIDFFDAEGNGIIEEQLLLKTPVVIKGGPEGYKSYGQELRRLILQLLDAHLIIAPEGTRLIHVKTNAIKKVSLSCVIIFKKDIVYARPDTGTAKTKDELGWAID